MIHLGDILCVKGSDIRPVDVITFGSPCQNLSIAGNGEGLSGSESSLFFEAIRVIKEMYDATNGKQPQILLWENVPGALSSCGGEDFRCVLEEFVRIKDREAVVPRPLNRRGKPEKWSKAGLIIGDGYSLAWRVIDNQFFGTPQRRRRIQIVMDTGGACAPQILFECESLSWNPQQSDEKWKGTARNPETSTGECGEVPLKPHLMQVRCGKEGGVKVH